MGFPGFFRYELEESAPSLVKDARPTLLRPSTPQKQHQAPDASDNDDPRPTNGSSRNADSLRPANDLESNEEYPGHSPCPDQGSLRNNAAHEKEFPLRKFDEENQDGSRVDSRANLTIHATIWRQPDCTKGDAPRRSPFFIDRPDV